MTTKPKVTALAPWFGSDRTNAKVIGQEIGKQAMVSVPCCGGCSVVVHIDARQILLNDKHRHIITLAKTVADDEAFAKMLGNVENMLVHPDYLAKARHTLANIEKGESLPVVDYAWAAAYFTNVWLSRSGTAGSNREVGGSIASRRTTGGGSSVRRWRSAVEGLPFWHEVLRDRCEFTCQEWFEFMRKVRDHEGHAIYVDPPWVDAGEAYIHRFTEQDQRDLATRLHEFKNCRVVVRHSDHPLYRELYPDWTWVNIGGRNQGNKKISEMLIINGPSFTQESESLF